MKSLIYSASPYIHSLLFCYLFGCRRTVRVDIRLLRCPSHALPVPVGQGRTKAVPYPSPPFSLQRSFPGEEPPGRKRQHLLGRNVLRTSTDLRSRGLGLAVAPLVRRRIAAQVSLAMAEPSRGPNAEAQFEFDIQSDPVTIVCVQCAVPCVCYVVGGNRSR